MINNLKLKEFIFVLLFLNITFFKW